MNTQVEKSPREEQTRAVEREIEINAPVAMVWKTLTDAEELTRWFPANARVTPGVGGSIWMSWPDSPGSQVPIEIWEPEQHLRTGPAPGAEARIATDYYLESRGRGTVLRVVSSGFGLGDEWDELYAAWGGGWDFELRGLRHYLERHPGRKRVIASASVAYTCGPEEAWRRLTEAGGWFGPAGLSSLSEGARYRAESPGGPVLDGVVFLCPLAAPVAVQWDGEGVERRPVPGGAVRRAADGLAFRLRHARARRALAGAAVAGDAQRPPDGLRSALRTAWTVSSRRWRN